MARQDAEKLILEWMDDIDLSGINTERWKAKFKAMSDDDFKKFVDDLKNKKDYVSVIFPNFSDVKVSTANNFKVAKKYGVKLFQRIWMVDPVTKRRYLSHDEYPIFHLPVRRQIQMVRNKFSYAKNNTKVDVLTGQPTSISAAGSISYPEMLVLHSRGLDNVIKELAWVRGGNTGAFRAMNHLIRETGSVNLSELERYSDGVKSTEVLNTYLKAAHINNNI